VHLWRSAFISKHGVEAPRTGWIAKQLRNFDLSRDQSVSALS
jgi:hypothetical protein